MHHSIRWLAPGAGVLIALTALAVRSDPAPTRADGALRIATYNILNLFDDRDDPSLTDRFDDFFDRSNGVRAKPASQQRAAAQAIRAIDADVLTLQEIESFDALIEFRERYLKGMGYEHVVSIDVGQERGIEQAVLSRHPIVDARVWPHMPLGGVHPPLYGDKPNWYAGEPIACRRSPLRVTVRIEPEAPGDADAADPYELTLFIVHHKAGRYNDYWREKESARFVELIAEVERTDPDANIAILGDFNAQRDDASMRTYFDAGLRDVRTVGGDAPSTEHGFTHESRRTIDFILVNRALEAEVVPGAAFVHRTPVRAKGADWRTTPAPSGFASDHFPVVVDLTPRDR